jgi:hypothetical protein
LIFTRQRTLAGESADLTPRFSRRLCPKMLNGARKNLSNYFLNCINDQRPGLIIAKLFLHRRDKKKNIEHRTSNIENSMEKDEETDL